MGPRRREPKDAPGDRGALARLWLFDGRLFQASARGPADLAAALAASPAASAFFEALSGTSRYAILFRIGAVTRAETRARKIAGFVKMLERGEAPHLNG